MSAGAVRIGQTMATFALNEIWQFELNGGSSFTLSSGRPAAFCERCHATILTKVMTNRNPHLPHPFCSPLLSKERGYGIYYKIYIIHNLAVPKLN